MILQTIHICLIVALLGCIGRDMLEAQFHCIAKILNNLAASPSASANASVQAIGLWYITVNAASNMGNLVQSDFGKQSLKPLAETMNCTLEELRWYYVAPGITSSECLFQMLPHHLRRR